MAYSAPIPPLGMTSKPAPIQSSFTEPNTFPLEATTCLSPSSSCPEVFQQQHPYPHHNNSPSSQFLTPRLPPRPNPFDIAPIFSTQWLPFAYRSTGTLV